MKYFSEIFDMRNTGDYDDFVDYSFNDINDVIEPAKNLISSMKELINQQIG